MRVFWVSIEVHLAQSIALVTELGNERAQLAGFVQELGVRAADEEGAKGVVRAHVATYDLGEAQTSDVIFLSIDEVEDGEAPNDERAVWFETGRSFYSEE
jgi:hypothetical protein